MKLWIGNPTGQDNDFLYRLKGEASRPSPYMIRIPAQNQVCLPQDMTQDQVDAIIAHQENYGARADADMLRLRFTAPSRAALVPLIYNVGKMVRDSAIVAVYHVNQETLEGFSGAVAEEVAVGIEQAVNEASSLVGQKPLAVEVETSMVAKKGAAPETKRVVRVTTHEGKTRRAEAVPGTDNSTGRRGRRAA